MVRGPTTAGEVKSPGRWKPSAQPRRQIAIWAFHFLLDGLADHAGRCTSQYAIVQALGSSLAFSCLQPTCDLKCEKHRSIWKCPVPN
jgi:hypothetical protein